MSFQSISPRNPSPWRPVIITPTPTPTPTIKNSILIGRRLISRTATMATCFKPQKPDTPLRMVNAKASRLTLVSRGKKDEGFELKSELGFVGSEENDMLAFCGFGYWVQGFRCFPWLALNFHMTQCLGLSPSTLQLVQTFASLPMAVKPIFGLFSDAFPIGGARRIPYISIGVALQILSWVPLALVPCAGRSVKAITALVLLSNLGASIAEVAKDGLVAERRKTHGLQSHAAMAIAAGAILGNLLAGFHLSKSPPQTTFLVFALVLSLQLTFASRTKENFLGLSKSHFGDRVSDLRTAIKNEAVHRPLMWIAASIAVVPSLSGSIFCYQTQCLKLDPSIVGLSRVIGQLAVLSAAVVYNRFWREIPLRRLAYAAQILSAASILLDLVLVRQVNLGLGISNEAFVLCFSGLAETVLQLKILPFLVMLSGLCPVGCEGSLMSFLASALCLSTMMSGFLGVGLGNMLGLNCRDYSNLAVAISVQFVAAMLPLLFVRTLPDSRAVWSARKRGSLIKRGWRKRRRVGRVVIADSSFFYRRERVKISK